MVKLYQPISYLNITCKVFARGLNIFKLILSIIAISWHFNKLKVSLVYGEELRSFKLTKSLSKI